MRTSERVKNTYTRMNAMPWLRVARRRVAPAKEVSGTTERHTSADIKPATELPWCDRWRRSQQHLCSTQPCIIFVKVAVISLR